MLTTEIDQQQCPLCHGDNACGNASKSKEGCWCAQEIIPPGLLEMIPDGAKGRSCLCLSCIKNQT